MHPQPGQTKAKVFLTKRSSFILFGVINIIVFHYAILRLWYFLYDTSSRGTSSSLALAILWDSVLVLFFCLPHSLLLRSNWKSFFTKYLPKGLYESFYSLHACTAIILMDEFWINFGPGIYDFKGINFYLMFALNIASWLFMLWAMIATGLFRQSGIEHWYLALRGRNVKNNLIKAGPYKFCRHPIYAAFLAMIWMTPHMNADHLFLSLSWSLYIFIGAFLKDKRLMRNKLYINYMESIPAFPLIPASLNSKMTWLLRRLV